MMLGYRADIDGLRAIAILGVVTYHGLPNIAPGGFAGVDVFFVISGYLISGIIFNALHRHAFSFADFYSRRVRRIFPALVIMLGTVWLMGSVLMLPDEFEQLGKHQIAGAGFALNFILYRDFDWYFQGLVSPLMHLWSLAVEEQFYLLWPLYAVVIWRFGKARFPLLGAITVASFVLNVVVVRSMPIASFYLPANRLWELSMGGMLAYAHLQSLKSGTISGVPGRFGWLGRLRFPVSGQIRGAIGILLVLVSFASFDDEMRFPGWWALVPCLGALLLISAGAESAVNRYFLSSRLMIFVGLISYPLYLWHWPLLSLGHSIFGYGSSVTAAAIGLAVLLAFLTYRFIERPVRTAVHQRAVTAFLCLLMVLGGSIGYMSYVQEIRPLSASADIDRIVRVAGENIWPKHIRHIRGTLIEEGNLELGNAQRRILFIGDSNMQQYYWRIQQVISDHPEDARSATFAVRGLCAPGAVDIEGNFRLIERYRPECRTYLGSVIDRYQNDPNVETVVIGASWYIYFVTLSEFGKPGALRPGTREALQALARTVRGFVNAGKRVYVVLQMPLSPKFDPHQMIRREVFPPSFTVDVRSPATAEITKAVGAINQEIVKISLAAGANVIDPIPSLCNDSICPAISASGEPVYRDSSHLSPTYVRDNVFFLDWLVRNDRDIDISHGNAPSTLTR